MDIEEVLTVVAGRPRWWVRKGRGAEAATPPGWPADVLLLGVDRDGVVSVGPERGGWSGWYHRSLSDFRAVEDGPGDDDPFDELPPGPRPEFFCRTAEELVGRLQAIERERDRRVLADRRADELRRRLVGRFASCLAAPGMPWESGGSLNVPGGGYVQWTRVDIGPSPLHVEVSDGGDYAAPMDPHLVALLVGLGWQAPDEQFRNCWARADGDAELDRAADLVLLALVHGFGVAPTLFDGLPIAPDEPEAEPTIPAPAEPTDLPAQRTTLVLREVDDDDGFMSEAVTLTDDGGLAIHGHDLGRGVERSWGLSEYEFERKLTAAETSTLRRLLSVAADGDLLAAIGDRFQNTNELETFVQENGIPGRFWNRVGD